MNTVIVLYVCMLDYSMGKRLFLCASTASYRASTASDVVSSPKLTRNAPMASFLGRRSAAITWLGLPLWQALPAHRRTQSARLIAAEAAVKLGKLDFVDECFKVDYAMIREGALGLATVWFEAEARKKAAAENRAFTEADIDRTLPLPWELDYRRF